MKMKVAYQFLVFKLENIGILTKINKGDYEFILKIINRENLLSENPNEIIYEGEVLKYKPGMNTTYMKRWGQLSRKEFKYYKDKYHSSQWLARPLASICLFDIKEICKVELVLENNYRSRPEIIQPKYGLEIIPKQLFSNDRTNYENMPERIVINNKKSRCRELEPKSVT